MSVSRSNYIQEHTMIAGVGWGVATAILIYVFDRVVGWDTPNLLITVLIFAIAGPVWGYSMKRFFDRRSA
jgi:high-affinity Fe2+/Pb2+ permease